MELPEDVISEIFSRLPAKAIFKFKSCCKSISNFTNNTYFALKQAQNMIPKGDSSLFIQGSIFIKGKYYGYEYKKIEYKKTKVYELPGNETSSSGIPTKFLEFLNKREISIVASSNGLLLCLTTIPKLVLFICNPATQSCSFIATPACLSLTHHDSVEFAFVWNRSTEEFQLIYFDKNPRQGESSWEFVCKVYMPKGGWKERGSLSLNEDRSKIYGYHVFYKGNIYFASSFVDSSYTKRYHFMSSYNFETGVTRRVNFPAQVVEIGLKPHGHWDYEIYIFKWGKAGTSNDDESICVVSLINYSVFTIWVLTDLESSSWSKFLSVSLKEMGLEENDPFVYDFIVMNGDSLVFISGNTMNVHLYDLIGARGKRLEKIGQLETDDQSVSIIPYSNTLRSCGAGVKRFRRNRKKLISSIKEDISGVRFQC